MAAYECSKHGTQIAAHFCSHAKSAIDVGENIELYLQKDHVGWYSVCESCARKPKSEHAPDDLVCQKCIMEWAERTGSDYVDRCRAPKEEHPA